MNDSEKRIAREQARYVVEQMFDNHPEYYAIDGMSRQQWMARLPWADRVGIWLRRLFRHVVS